MQFNNFRNWSRQAEARAEFAERSVQKLQKEVDRLEGMSFYILFIHHHINDLINIRNPSQSKKFIKLLISQSCLQFEVKIDLSFIFQKCFKTL